jgi:hypothetical protein
VEAAMRTQSPRGLHSKLVGPLIESGGVNGFMSAVGGTAYGARHAVCGRGPVAHRDDRTTQSES